MFEHGRLSEWEYLKLCSQGTYENEFGIATSAFNFKLGRLAIRPGKSEMNRTASLPNDSISIKEEKSEVNTMVYMRNGRL